MAVEVKLPQLGMGMTVATIARWLKQVGETVELDEPLLEIEAEKATAEIGAPASGTLARIFVAAGEEAEVYSVIATIQDANGEAVTADSAVPAPPSSAPAPRLRREGGPPNASPLARRVAKENGIDVRALNGSGSSGRVVLADVQAVIARAAAPIVAPPAVQLSAASPLSAQRSVIARRLMSSLHESAQYTLMRRADVTALGLFRAMLRSSGDAVPTYGDFLTKAVALALRQHPALNATLTAEAHVLHDAIDIGIAVARPDGLIVPVLRGADKLSLAAIAAETRRLATAARAGALKGAECAGSTFSISNLGAHGIETFTPVLNPPEVAILGVGCVTDRAKRGADGGLLWRQAMALSLTLDHRVVDGAPGAAFLQTVADLLDQPALLHSAEGPGVAA